MPVSIGITPSSGSIVSASSACRVEVAGATVNDTAGYDITAYPSEPLVNYYLSFEKSGADTCRSQEFQVAADGSFTFNNFIFPASGTWTIHLRQSTGDASVANATAVVS